MSKLPSGSEDPPSPITSASPWALLASSLLSSFLLTVAPLPTLPLYQSSKRIEPWPSSQSASFWSLRGSMLSPSLPLARPFDQAFSSLSLVHLHLSTCSTHRTSLLCRIWNTKYAQVSYSHLSGCWRGLLKKFWYWSLLPWQYHTGMLRRLQQGQILSSFLNYFWFWDSESESVP